MDEYFVKADIYDENGILLIRKGQLIKKSTADRLRKYKLAFGSLRSIQEDNTLTVKPINTDEIISRYHIQDIEMVDYSNKILENIIFDRDKPWYFHIKLLSNYADWLYDHSIDTSLIAIMIGQQLNYTDWQLYKLGLGALLHDIGKLVVPAEILNRGENLNDTEKSILRQHCILGVRSMKSFDLYEESMDIILHHHERLDGSGYPEGLKGDEISQNCRIVMIADTIDVITSGTKYKNSSPIEEAIDFIKNKGIKYPQDVLDAFISMIEPSYRKQGNI